MLLVCLSVESQQLSGIATPLFQFNRQASAEITMLGEGFGVYIGLLVVQMEAYQFSFETETFTPSEA